MLKKLMAKMQNEEGQGLVEYALIIVLVSIACVICVGNSWGRQSPVYSPQSLTSL